MSISITKYYADFIVDNVNNINRRIKDKMIGYHDSARVLTFLLTMSEYNEDYDTYDQIINKLDGLINKYNLVPYSIILSWKRYMRYSNDDDIMLIYRSYLGIDYLKYEYLKPFLMTLGCISSLIIENEIEEHYENAITWNEETTFQSSGLVNIGISTYIMYNDIINIIYNLKKCILQENYEGINNSRKHIVSFNETAGKTELLKSIIYKTEILIYLVNDDYDGIQNSINNLLNIINSNTINNFCNEILNWYRDYDEKTGRSFILTEYINYDTIDPWKIFFYKYIYHKMKEDIELNLINYDAILVLEGKTDVKIFKNFSKIIIPNKRILFMDLEGYTNLILFYKEIQILKSFNIPIYCIFDGDTKNNEKMKNIKNRLLKDVQHKEIQIFTLNKNTIENYLINSKSIKKAYPKIKDSKRKIRTFLESKKNKKVLFNKLFISNDLGHYDSVKAENISKNMELGDIDKEIHELLKKL